MPRDQPNRIVRDRAAEFIEDRFKWVGADLPGDFGNSLVGRLFHPSIDLFGLVRLNILSQILDGRTMGTSELSGHVFEASPLREHLKCRMS